MQQKILQTTLLLGPRTFKEIISIVIVGYFFKKKTRGFVHFFK